MGQLGGNWGQGQFKRTHFVPPKFRAGRKYFPLYTVLTFSSMQNQVAVGLTAISICFGLFTGNWDVMFLDESFYIKA